MHKTTKSALLVAAGLSAPLFVASYASAAAVVSLTLTVNTTTDTWTAFEQNSGSTPQSGLGGLEFSVIGTGGVNVATSKFSLPDGNDDDMGLTGFVTLRGNGTAGVNILGYQPNTYAINSEGDATNVYLNVGNTAESINTGDSGGSPTDRNVADPVQIGTGTYTNNGSGGTLTVSSATTLITLLPSPMPTPVQGTGTPYSTFSPDTVNGQTVTIPGTIIPEPTSLGLLAIGSLGVLRRRRSTI